MKYRMVIDSHGDIYSDYILEEGDEGYEENYNEYDSDHFGTWDMILIIDLPLMDIK